MGVMGIFSNMFWSMEFMGISLNVVSRLWGLWNFFIHRLWSTFLIYLGYGNCFKRRFRSTGVLEIFSNSLVFGLYGILPYYFRFSMESYRNLAYRHFLPIMVDMSIIFLPFSVYGGYGKLFYLCYHFMYAVLI